jgi:hypothetical protein
MPELAMAARVGDTIGHSPILGLALGGIALGIALGVALVALTIATGGADLLVGAAAAEGTLSFGAAALAGIGAVAEAAGLGSLFCTATAGMYTFATWIGSAFTSPSIPSGNIKAGASTVFIGPGTPAAARYQDAIDCQEPASTYIGAVALGSVIAGPVGMVAAAAIVYANSGHVGAKLDQGSKTVLTEGKSQSRVGDKTTCGGAVSTGCETVFVGGPPNRESDASELPKRLTEIMELVDKTGVYLGLISGIGGLTRAIGEEGLKKALLSDEGREALFGVLDTALLALETRLKHQEEELARRGRDHHETTEEREREEHDRTIVETVKITRDGLRQLHELLPHH